MEHLPKDIINEIQSYMGNNEYWNMRQAAKRYNLRFNNNADRLYRLYAHKSIQDLAEAGKLEGIIYLVESGKGMHNINLAFLYGAVGGHLDVLKYLVKLGANKYYYGLPIRAAAEHGHLDVLIYLLEILHYKSEKESGYCEAFIIAAMKGHLEIVKYLLKLQSGCTSQGFFQAAENGHLNVVQYLVESKSLGTMMYYMDRDLQIALLYAYMNNSEVTLYLIETRANIKGLDLMTNNGHVDIPSYIREAFKTIETIDAYRDLYIYYKNRI